MATSANRYLILFLLFVAAAVSYGIGFMVGFWLLIALGVVFELIFWGKLLVGPRRR